MTQNLDSEFQVYSTWSEDAVRQALADFKHEMYDGAGIAELQGGLRCLEFLTTKTQLPADLEEDMEATAFQANLRISLMAAQPRATAASDNALEIATRGVAGLGQLVNSYKRRFLEGATGYHVDDVYAAVERRIVSRRFAAAA